MELKPGYKQTEVGVIPEEWEVKTIKEFAAVKGGKRLPLGKTLLDKQTPHPYIRVTDMRAGGVDLGDIKYVPEDVFPSIKNYRISSNDIFISVAGTLGIVGKIPVELDGANLTENADKITNIGCDRDFLLYNLMSERVQSIIASERTVGAQPKLALGRIETFIIALPPKLPEQRAIATALSDVDDLIASLDRLVAKKHDMKQAAMQELLTGKRRLPGFSGEWEVKRLGDIAEIFDGTHQTPKYVDSGVPFYSVENVTSGDFTNTKFISESEHRSLTKSFKIEKGDILMTRIGSIGDCKLIDWDVDASFYVSLALLKMRKPYSASFVCHYSNSAFFKKEVELNSLQSAIPRKINL